MPSGGEKLVSRIALNFSFIPAPRQILIYIYLPENADRDIDDLTPLDARQSLLMDNPARKEYAEMAKFNYTGPYEPYRDQVHPHTRQSPTGSTDRLVDASYPEDDRHGRSESRQSRHSRDSHGSPEGREPTKPAQGF